MGANIQYVHSTDIWPCSSCQGSALSRNRGLPPTSLCPSTQPWFSPQPAEGRVLHVKGLCSSLWGCLLAFQPSSLPLLPPLHPSPPSPLSQPPPQSRADLPPTTTQPAPAPLPLAFPPACWLHALPRRALPAEHDSGYAPVPLPCSPPVRACTGHVRVASTARL